MLLRVSAIPRLRIEDTAAAEERRSKRKSPLPEAVRLTDFRGGCYSSEVLRVTFGVPVVVPVVKPEGR